MKQAIILAGGKGERLRPYTEDKPKCMLPVLGRPLLSFTLQWLNSYGINHVYVTCGYRHEAILEFFGDGTKYGLKIDYIIEEKPRGRGGAIKSALAKIDTVNETVLALNGDIITNLNLHKAYESHSLSNSYATIITTPLLSPYGIVDISENNNMVHGFREKPELPFWVNAGIYLLNPRILDLLPEHGDHEETTFPELAQQGLLNAYKSRAFWRTVDTVKDLGELRNELEQLFLGAFLQNAVAG